MEEQGGGFLSKPRNLIIVAIVGVLAIGVFLARRNSSTSSTSATPQYIPTTGDTTVNYTYTQAVPASAPGAPAVPPASTSTTPGPTVSTSSIPFWDWFYQDYSSYRQTHGGVIQPNPSQVAIGSNWWQLYSNWSDNRFQQTPPPVSSGVPTIPPPVPGGYLQPR